MSNVELWIIVISAGSATIGALLTFTGNYLFPDQRRAAVRLETAKAEKDTADANLTTATALNKNVETITTLGALAERLTSKIEIMSAEYAIERHTLREELDALKHEMAVLKDNHAKQILELQQQHEKQISTINEGHRAEMERLLQQHQAEMTRMKNQHQAEMERLQGENKAALERISILEDTLKKTQVPEDASKEKAA